jgi:hypothetical protein
MAGRLLLRWRIVLQQLRHGFIQVLLVLFLVAAGMEGLRGRSRPTIATFNFVMSNLGMFMIPFLMFWASSDWGNAKEGGGARRENNISITCRFADLHRGA